MVYSQSVIAGLEDGEFLLDILEGSVKCEGFETRATMMEVQHEAQHDSIM